VDKGGNGDDGTYRLPSHMQLENPSPCQSLMMEEYSAAVKSLQILKGNISMFSISIKGYALFIPFGGVEPP